MDYVYVGELKALLWIRYMPGTDGLLSMPGSSSLETMRNTGLLYDTGKQLHKLCRLLTVKEKISRGRYLSG
ncbi:MAG TPA: hypothetical protein DCZ91_11340 [Lachnospiraceae bacterium]|nr:hypothetical protein [Lachnospiraceae bacterium]